MRPLKSFLIALSLSLLAGLAAQAAQPPLKPFKDELFAYPKVLEKKAGGDYLLVAYSKQRDLIERDKVPLRKANRQYVDESVRWNRRVRSYRSPNGTFKHFEAGQSKGARITVVYVHGKGGNRRQGVDDWTFGGNFNRLQNLMVNNNGLLLTPDFTDFKEKGAADIAALMAAYRTKSPNTTMVVACGSMGGGVCWRLAREPGTAQMMDGMLILGSHWHDDFLTSPTVQKGGRAIPIYFGHSNDDVVFDHRVQLDFFNRIRKQNPNYPSRFVMFDTGRHGTPIRMVDWRRELNWILSLKK